MAASELSNLKKFEVTERPCVHTNLSCP